ncbi:MAG: hypothetical protein GTN65_00015, partial [Armatimonadetes bacterium]|nr:hypothetical protein [Armatimonadota bacterium]NIO95512.1 hypothetical protein [Armatimonadota bacterium]
MVITACLCRRARYGGRIWLAIAISALLSPAAVSDCHSVKKETAKTPPLTQAAGGSVLVGIVRGSEIGFAGVWEPKTGWRNAANADEDKELMPEGTVWTLYGLNQSPVKVTSGPPTIHWRFEGYNIPREPEDCYVTAVLTNPPEGEYPLAVSGIDFMDDHPVRVLPPQEDPATNRLCRYLLENGPFKKVEKILQVVRADLDGDGKEEHLVAFHGNIWAYYEPTDMAGEGAEAGVVAVAHTTASGTYRVSTLTEIAQSMLRGPYFQGAGAF